MTPQNDSWIDTFLKDLPDMSDGAIRIVLTNRVDRAVAEERKEQTNTILNRLAIHKGDSLEFRHSMERLCDDLLKELNENEKTPQ